MNKSKKKKLEKKGWKIGLVTDFLELTPEEAEFIELKLNLSDLLREKRKLKKYSQVELADQLYSSQPRVAKMEKGDDSVSIDLLIRALLSLGTTRKELAKIIGEAD